MRLRGALCVLMAVLMYAWREIKEEGIDREEGRGRRRESEREGRNRRGRGRRERERMGKEGRGVSEKGGEGSGEIDK